MNGLVILGGSSPFTAALIDALHGAVPTLPPLLLTIHGRDLFDAQIIAAYAQRRLARRGWEVRATSDLARAIEGAALIINQIRFGGPEARARDEEFARRFGALADETLGPAGLRSAIRVARSVTDLARHIRAISPDALVVNLSNPLGVSTAVFASQQIACVGVCELPLLTLRGIAALVGRSPADLSWRYVGLNHRGFFFDLEDANGDLLPELLDRLGTSNIGGVHAETIGRIRAVPLKYYQVYEESPPVPQDAQASRAGEVAEIRAAVARELQLDLDHSPPSLSRRNQCPWYEQAVVPLLGALTSKVPQRLIVNVLRPGTTLVEEQAALVSSAGISPVTESVTGRALEPLVHRYRDQDAFLLRALLVRDPDSLRQAVDVDSLIPAVHRADVFSALWSQLQGEA